MVRASVGICCIGSHLWSLRSLYTPTCLFSYMYLFGRDSPFFVLPPTFLLFLPSLLSPSLAYLPTEVDTIFSDRDTYSGSKIPLFSLNISIYKYYQRQIPPIQHLGLGPQRPNIHSNSYQPSDTVILPTTSIVGERIDQEHTFVIDTIPTTVFSTSLR
ncbi:hypothetical protein F5Y05DRAFT_216082 [Hypoxylon sp. FL0543]|nr:hypothetical protein F5Y05DRAFT_216082 [Hypoxylon sp. FL0543]